MIGGKKKKKKHSFLCRVPACFSAAHTRARHILYGVSGTKQQSSEKEIQIKRKKLGRTEVHLPIGKKEPTCFEVMQPFLSVLAPSTTASHPFMQMWSLKRRLFSGRMTKKLVWTCPRGWRGCRAPRCQLPTIGKGGACGGRHQPSPGMAEDH